MLKSFKFACKHMQVLVSRFYSSNIVLIPDPKALHRLPPPCSCPPFEGPITKPCFDINAVTVERARENYEPLIKSFLYTHYFNREPSIVGLYIPLNSYYLEYLAKHYIRESSAFLAFEIDPRSGEKTMVGMLVGNKKYPWEADKFEKWGDICCDPERIHMYFRSHCFRHPNIFNKYKVPFVYDIEMLATSSNHTGQGVAQLLLRSAILYAIEMRFPVVHMITTNSYMNRPCKRLNMKKEWTMKYLDYVDWDGHSVFCPRQPHTEVSIFVRPLQHSDRGCPDQMYDPELFKLFTTRFGSQDCKIQPLELYPPLPTCPTRKLPLPRKPC